MLGIPGLLLLKESSLKSPSATYCRLWSSFAQVVNIGASHKTNQYSTMPSIHPISFHATSGKTINVGLATISFRDNPDLIISTKWIHTIYKDMIACTGQPDNERDVVPIIRSQAESHGIDHPMFANRSDLPGTDPMKAPKLANLLLTCLTPRVDEVSMANTLCKGRETQFIDREIFPFLLGNRVVRLLSALKHEKQSLCH